MAYWGCSGLVKSGLVFYIFASRQGLILIRLRLLTAFPDIDTVCQIMLPELDQYKIHALTQLPEYPTFMEIDHRIGQQSTTHKNGSAQEARSNRDRTANPEAVQQIPRCGSQLAHIRAWRG
jgi:hypothetical protein